jgi:hypothetical protein
MAATHRCKVCGALWRFNPPDPGDTLFPRGSWTVQTPAVMGACCDQAPMGDQIEPLDALEGMTCGPNGECPACGKVECECDEKPGNGGW